MWLVLGLLLPYLKQRILLFLGKWKTTWTEKLISIVTFVDKILTILELINYAVFIRRGEYRSLLQRVLGIRMQFINDRHKRILNFSLMNRQLLWRVYE